MVVGNKVARFDIKIQIGAIWTKDIYFSSYNSATGVSTDTNLTGATFSFILKRNIGDRLSVYTLTLNNGIAFITYVTNGIRITSTATQNAIEEGEYVFELRRTDLDRAVASGKAIVTYDAR